ncbi:hypothetical protein [Methylococcus sp. EFPC2]|uniref:hypothetical protein n=1 Tax=Methylococcus sp. EFPC2 TaxID=2812648 RepID=UPI0019678D7B|nr:hypothetical protein [Methylococcus sp. EFPC2]QSA96671.1 hypothetical protein JWZ97_15870 [Methylococcus sp. EFPC2]
MNADTRVPAGLGKRRAGPTGAYRNDKVLLTGLQIGLLALMALYQARARAEDSARFDTSFKRQYEQVRSLAPDIIVLELRDRIELVASRGSQVNAASYERRVRGFESALLRNLDAPVCKSASPAGTPSPAIIAENVKLAANSQSLRTSDEDVAELSALTQGLIDGLTLSRWCRLKSLDEIR